MASKELPRKFEKFSRILRNTLINPFKQVHGKNEKG